MRKIIYYVATSLDGFIAGPDEDISGFMQQGPGVDQYLADLQKFDTVIMGRKTYEFGYRYGLVPGQPAYPHMDHHIFSQTLQLDQLHEKVNIHPLDVAIIRQLKQQPGKDIYLCGGGDFAGWLLQEKLIDQVKIKLNPFVLGRGVPLFANLGHSYQLQLVDSKAYASGLQIMTYNII